MRRLLYVIFGLIGIVALLSISRLFGGGEGATPPAETVVAVGIVTSSTRFWVLFVLGVLVLMVWAVINYFLYPAGTTRTMRLSGTMPPVWAFAVLLGVTAFHWLFWAVSPGAWNTWLSSQTFWPMNVAIILAAFFASQHGPAARYASFALWALLLVAIGIGVYGYIPWSSYWPAGVARVGGGLRSSSSLSRLPAEVALPIIAQCESGGRQLNQDGSVVTNKNKDGTIDRGKWQINSRHDAEAKRRSIDLTTEEGNRQFAVILYTRNDLLDWEASRHCWEPKLLALGRTPTATMLVLRSEKPAAISVPPGHRWDLVGEIPTRGWTTDNGYRDVRGNRIQVFEVVPPADGVRLQVSIRRCTTAQDCAW